MLLLALKHAQRSAREEEMKKCNPVTTWSSEMAQASQPRLGEYGKGSDGGYRKKRRHGGAPWAALQCQRNIREKCAGKQLRPRE